MTPEGLQGSFDAGPPEAEYGGIGAYVDEDPDDDLFTITQPDLLRPGVPRRPALTDDKIVRIDDWPTLGRAASTTSSSGSRASPGTTVKLYVWRRGMDAALIDRPTEDMAVEIEREQITIPPVQVQMLPGEIGHDRAARLQPRRERASCARSIRELQEQGMQALVLDLRNNSGGLLDRGRNVADLFLPQGQLVVTTESRVRGHARAQDATRRAAAAADMPVAC